VTAIEKYELLNIERTKSMNNKLRSVPNESVTSYCNVIS